MIDAIGFDNFRNFEHFPMISLNKINLFVGKNNSGKSTISKAIQLLFDRNGGLIEFLRFPSCQNFAFEKIGIGDFKRAKCSYCDNDTITFRATFNDFYFELDIVDDMASGAGRISRLSIHDIEAIIKFEVRISGSGFPEDGLKTDQDCSFSIWTSEDYTTPESIINKYNLENTPIKDQDPDVNLKQLWANGSKRLGRVPFWNEDIVCAFEEYRDWSETFEAILDHAKGSSILHESKLNNWDIEQYRGAIEILLKKATKSMERLRRSIVSQNLDFKALQSPIRDAVINSNGINSSAKIISDYYRSHGANGTPFVKKWLKKFDNIGDDIVITAIQGSYVVSIVDTKKGILRNLCDYGSGTIQLVFIVLWIESLNIITDRSTNLFGKVVRGFTNLFRDSHVILFEEPEVNLHPNLQVLLCELMYEVIQRSKSQIIIETHSEYFVRATQKHIGELYDRGEASPYSVFYIEGDTDTPWRIIPYNKYGQFQDDFGPGFMDVAQECALAVYKRKLKGE